MKRRLAPLVAVLVLASGCSRAPRQVVFGIGLAPNAHPAVALAAREINASGGIGGARLVLLELSDARGGAYDPAVVLSTADRFVKAPGLLGVIGHNDSATTLSAGAVYNRHGLPHLVTIASNPAITNIGPWTYRLCLSDSAQGPALAEYAVTTWKKRRIAVFAVNDDYGRALAERFEARARSLGAAILAVVPHRNELQPDDQEAIRSALASMKAAPPDLFVLFQRVDAALWTLRAIREAGVQAGVLGGDDLAQARFFKAEPELTRDLRVSQFYKLDEHDTRAPAFVAGLRAMGTEPDHSRAFAYDAVYLMRDAAVAGGLTRAGIRDYLDRLVRDHVVVRGVAGPFTFGPDHDARRPLYIAEFRDGAFQTVHTCGE